MQDARLQIDRLVLSLPGGSAADGRKVGDLVVAGLATAGALPQSGDLPNLSVTVNAAMGRRPEAVARQIVDQVLRALARNV
jgi:hypothetical protein